MLTVPAPPRLSSPAESPPRAAQVTLETQRAVEQFLYRQSECLDAKRWPEFIDLFAPAGVYWMPARPDQTTGDGEPSIFYEDRDMMRIRVKRIGHPRAWSQKTAWGTSHVVANVIVEHEDANSIACRARFTMMEFRRDAVRHFAGSYIHHLVRFGDDFRIKLQRVDLVNGDAPFDYVLQGWV